MSIIILYKAEVGEILKKSTEKLSTETVAYPAVLLGGGGFKQIQLRTGDRENGDLGAVAP
jgi:hypothetical protein